MFSLIIARHPQIIEKVFKRGEALETFACVNATSTAAESDEFSPFIDNKEGQGKKIINTGSIDRYVSLWGIGHFQNKGATFVRPYLHTEKIDLSKHRRLIYDAPKIIIAKVSKRVEAFLDTGGEYASINTNCIYNPTRGVTLDYLLGLLSSRLMSFVYDECFGALKMSGGISAISGAANPDFAYYFGQQ